MNSARAAEYCAFCGLPLTPAIGGGRAASDQADYCCSGCRVAAAVTEAPEADAALRRLMLRIGLAVFFTMNVVVFTMELWSQDVYADPSFATPLAVHLRGLFLWASLVFSAPVLLLLGGPIATNVWRGMRQRVITTDLLILLGVAAAYLYSSVSVVRGHGQVYFEVGCVVLVFLSIGRWLEARGKYRTGSALDALAQLLPAMVRVRRPALVGGIQSTEFVPREQVRMGDVVRVLPGERLAIDGRIVAGIATLDEQIVTGESRTVVKSVGDQVYSGVLNADGDLWIEASAAAGDDMVSRMLALVREARRTKGRHERLADRVAAWFTPLVCLAAVLVAWSHGAAEGVDRGILAGLAVVLIACPCALGLATPMAIWTALGKAAGEQVLFRSGAVLERLAAVDTVFFDKTGTLTSGEPEVSEVIVAAGNDYDAVLDYAARLASGSMHSLSRAIGTFVARQADADAPLDGVELPAVSATAWRVASLRTFPGRGVAALDGAGSALALLGSSRWMTERRQTMPDDLANRMAEAAPPNSTPAFVAWGGQVRGVFLFREHLRDDARAAVAACQAMGLQVVMLTGDLRERAATLSRELGLDGIGEQLPQDKAAVIKHLGGRSAMVGDGINDAPALASAEVGVALGCGADLSRDAAGVCLLGDQLVRLPWAIGLARQTMRVVRQNLFWAFAYNSAGIVLAATGRLNPIWAAAAMGLSSILVIGNSLRLARYGGVGPERDPLVDLAPTKAEGGVGISNNIADVTPNGRTATPTALAGACP